MEQQSQSTTPTIPITKRSRICSSPVRVTCEVLLLLLLFAPFIVFITKWPSVEHMIQGKVLEKTRLAPLSDGNESWTNPPITTLRAYRLFNVTNYMDIMTDTNNPTLNFQETLPFMYKVVVKKNNPKWFDNNTKIHYSIERIFTRYGEYSEALLSQEGAFVDILRVMFRTKFGRVADPVFYILGGNNAFNYSKAIDKLEGYISPIFAAISSRMQGPNKDKYGFIYRYNGTNGFNFTIQTGIDNSSIKGQMLSFETEYTPFKTKSQDWQTDIFDGLTFPPLGNPPNQKVINVFQPDFCRPVQLRYNRTVSKFGFEMLHEYVLKLVDVEKCPQMDENCPEADKLDITKCLSAEIPEETVFLSKPHFYGHNSSSTNVNFHPNFDKHESTIYFEPISGTPVRAQLRIQLSTNAWIDRLKLNQDGSTEPTRTRAVRRFIPMMWIDQTITLNNETLNRLLRVSTILEKGHYAYGSLKLIYIIIALLSLIAIVVVLELFFFNRRRRADKHLLYAPSKDQEKELLRPPKNSSQT
ncbi:unnamed protein product [Adineta ricciae]|uniref:Uncharacterized protein n=1 Tax=Adineta ricciae TaxID=249248 RepID=A0A814P037_ADIRI|nr:unnamed protein product [Adineta ricciae]CAF1340493.1 unnamed protein product [Adineta ricciae]